MVSMRIFYNAKPVRVPGFLILSDGGPSDRIKGGAARQDKKIAAGKAAINYLK